MERNTFIMALLAFVLVALATPFQIVGIPLAPLAALILGAVAGWWVSRAHGEGTAASGGSAGVITGVGALLGSIIGLALLALFIGNISDVQAYIQASEPHPEARIPTSMIAPIAALGGIIGGFVLGMVDLVLSAIGGLFAALLYGHRPVTKM